MANPIIDGLNPNQKEAVEHLSGPLLILAGAGSGKTRVLTHRVSNLIAHGVPGKEILAVTFTNKAAKEMQTRIDKIIGLNDDIFMSKPTVGTFHSICVRILRKEIEALGAGYTSNFIIFDTDDSLKLIKLIMKEQGFEIKEIKPRAVLSHISAAKNQLCTMEEFYESMGTPEFNRFAQAVKRLAPLFKKRLIEHNALDFDDLLEKTVEVLSMDDILTDYRAKWKHVLVDEYQDTNLAQYKIIRLLADEHQNLCVVGDDHQSIYSFRGADYRNILEFEQDFPNAVVVKLEQNYRSTGNILNNANSLIDKNQTGRKKNLWTENESGEMLTVMEVSNEKEEGQFIAEQIQQIQSKTNASYQNFAVLYRMNAQSRALEEAFMRKQIPYQIVGGVRFFDRKEIKDVIGYLRLIFNSRDDVSFLRIINTPSRKLGAATLNILREYAIQYGICMFEVLDGLDEIDTLPVAKKVVLKNFQLMILELQKLSKTEPISILLDKLIDKVGFYKYLDDGTAEGQSRVENVRELFSVAGRYDTSENGLSDFLEGVALISDLDNVRDSDTVTLMTVHASKGLEFPIVFLPGWEENMFPSSASQFDNELLEEERRLGYVAITRAERQCFISHAKQRMLFGRTEFGSASRFLTELDAECHTIDSTVSSFGTDLGRGKNFSAKQYYNQGKSTPQYTPKNNTGSSDSPKFIDFTKQPKTKNEAIFGVTENETEFKISDRVEHPEYGEGTIIKIAGDILSIAFSGKGIKKVVASVTPLVKV